MSQPRSSLVSSRSASIVENAHHRIAQQDGPQYCPSEESDDPGEHARQDSRHEQGGHQQHKQHDPHQHIEHAKQLSQSEAEDGHHQREGVRPLRRLGPWFMLCMGWSLLAIAGSVAFISWLWWSPDDDYRWRQWVLATNRLQLSVTITGFIVRAAVGALAASTTAMLASVAVERSGVRAHAIAQVSMARFTAGGGFVPLSLLALRSSISGTSVRLLLGCLVVTTVGLQLTSTLLVSDLGERELVSNPQQISNAYAIVGNNGIAKNIMQSMANTLRFVENKPQLAETFAEYAEPDLRLEADGLDDTGPIVRAFLPMVSQEDRESISKFQGMARVYESRVVCVRPTISEMRPCRSESEVGAGFCGTIQLDHSAAVAAIGAAVPSMKLYFNCDLEFGHSGNVWQLCKTTQLDRMDRNSSSRGDSGLRMSNIEWALGNQTNRRPFKTMWLLWNTDEITYFGAAMEAQAHPGVILNSSAERSGPWMNMSFRLNDTNRSVAADFHLKISLCTRPSGSQDIVVEQLNITASTSSAERKKEPTYSLHTESQTYDTCAFRRQLGAARPTAAVHDRQILTISPADLRTSLRRAHDSKYDAKYSPTWNRNANGSTATPSFILLADPPYINFCLDCYIRLDVAIADIFYVHMLNSIINETNSPALALQAVGTAMARVMYYKYMNLYTPENNETATVTFYSPTIIPVHHRGYWAAMALLAIFLAVFAVVCFLFSSTQFSLPDNAWHTVAQISESAETSSILSRVRVKSDDEVRAMSKELQDDDEEDRFVVRRGVFVRASTLGTTVSDDQEAPFLKFRGWRRRQ
ncbi:hypothetical protein CPLU01_10169 [Colletotrichum plurivorum]|uniref:Uncharacterized protein n=1 Tax=Colletotrichum plurivorum TaxID=2175906 RepID=A0A8H6K6Y8_9PEZI|nr:hypothetical protein CPLU01_10169 [Colletotrichum plurivorum]